jgi:hypothetical protein
MLPALVDALLAARVTVLDVGRVPLGPDLCVVDIGHPYGRVLELGSRLGAQFVTCRAGDPDHDPVEFFARLAELAGRYHVRPLLSPAAGTAVATLDQAIGAIEGTEGGVVLDVAPGRDTPDGVDETIVELGDRLGYVRVSAHALARSAAPGLLATLPSQVPVAIGGPPEDPDTSSPLGAEAGEVTGRTDTADVVARVAALRTAVDLLLRHPQASTTPSG